MHSILRRLAALLLLTVAVTPLGSPPQARAAQVTPPGADQGPPVELPPVVEDESAVSNDEPATAVSIGNTTAQRWIQPIQGTIGGASDVDYYRFQVTQPASSVKLSLDGLEADYDLVLAGGPDPSQGFDAGQPGLEGVTEIGSQISAIGSQISAISAQSGTTAESIETFLWLPGTYYAVVAPSNGQFTSQPYNLTVQVDGSGLGTPPPTPHVELRTTDFDLEQITTLYIVNSARMLQLYPDSEYPGSSSQVASILNILEQIAAEPPSPNPTSFENGLVLDISELQPLAQGTPTITETYDLWEANQSNPLYANYVASLIDNLIDAARDDETPGSSVPPPPCPLPGPCPAPPSADYLLGSPSGQLVALPNLRNIVLVGGDEIIPFFRLPDLTTIANEADYLAYLQTIDPTGVIGANNPLGAALRYRMITSDNPYGSGRPYRFYGFPFFLPDLAVGRIVERPADIARFLDNIYADPSASIYVHNDVLRSEPPYAAVTGYDFLKDQADAIADTLVQAGLAITEVTTLIDDQWTADDLKEAWFNGKLDTEFSDQAPNSPFENIDIPLSSINAHFDHWQVLPAQGTAGNFPARRLLTPQYSFSFILQQSSGSGG